MKKYLESTQYIDWETPTVFLKAKSLAIGLFTHENIARRCFEFVRDDIKQSWDCQLNPVTCKASEALNTALATVTPKAICWPHFSVLMALQQVYVISV